ncbi:cytochrome bd-II ubiquinol oxidase subunit 1 [Variibacter gotjawalensis]|uniref:Cytochrome bd-II ubiquinol oxidase subunit 1 n=1 Tax=Variibacter gotjawalensis TaxID=1333996 RepID=A0A0S3PSW6_9BRAD|nr:cytochrome ubiquinol oxidase subunit I [Variibacter gotjawalensis]NIK49361.1 cytochrome d ubiquinol oxidase subunit I [Variibacter gotjawalensis]RZS51212.1 cytochrome bd-I ubiquinol oxidase subunit 1 apoprotein [Variibacter gotjawalensis]BAT59046.1 cytochrome bd-II ubiquinol oxidase subunit 1 [Variibacter gotjawalensis]
MELDAVVLARIQFAFTITFHIIFPSFTIGLSAYIATLGVMWLRTGEEKFRRIAQFWTKIFAVSFAMGVVSGIVLSYQFGTNWSRFSVVVGNVMGPLLGYEVLMAFFLEATFLGIMLFGADRVPPWLHVLSSAVVAVGTTLSAFWILAANSWMQTPAGHEIRDGIAYPVDWLQIIFNPSFPYRFAHMLNACYITTAFCVIAVGARYLITNRHHEEARTMMRMGIGLLVILTPLQLFIGDAHGLNTLKHQPLKVAAMEAHWDGSKPAPLVLFAWPDEINERNRYEISIPRLASLILTHDINGLFPGLKSVAPQDRPPVKNVFFAFRIMVGLGLFMIAAAFFGLLLWWKRDLFDTRWYLWIVSKSWWMGFVAIIAGWVVTESGRQPWIATGILRTRDAISPVPASTVLTTLILFVVVYSIVFSAGIYFINRLIEKGPTGRAIEPPDGVPNRPITGATEAARDATR